MNFLSFSQFRRRGSVFKKSRFYCRLQLNRRPDHFLVESTQSALSLCRRSRRLLLTTDDVEDKHLLAIVPVEHAARRLDDLTVAGAAKLPRHRPTLGMSAELF